MLMVRYHNNYNDLQIRLNDYTTKVYHLVHLDNLPPPPPTMEMAGKGDEGRLSSFEPQGNFSFYFTFTNFNLTRIRTHLNSSTITYYQPTTTRDYVDGPTKPTVFPSFEKVIF